MDHFIRALPPLSRLRPFEAAARLESFTLAAAELGLTQTAVSKQISALEADLGITLFERRNRAVFLTDEGQRLGRVVSDSLMAIAVEAAHLRGATQPGGLVLHCQLCEAFYWLMPRLSRFHQQHPGVEVRVVTSLAPLTEAPEPFDIAIQTTGRPSGTARLAFTAPDEIFPVCAPEWVGTGTQTLTPADLLTLPLLSHHVLPQDWMDWSEWFSIIGHRMPSGTRTIPLNSYPLVIQAAIGGQGIALAWRRTVNGLIDEGKLVRPCPDSVHRPTDLSVFRGMRRRTGPEVTALLDWLREELERDA